MILDFVTSLLSMPPGIHSVLMLFLHSRLLKNYIEKYTVASYLNEQVRKPETEEHK